MISRPNLSQLAKSADFDWIADAADRLAEVERGMRRNLLRSLSLDSFATALEQSRPAPARERPEIACYLPRLKRLRL